MQLPRALRAESSNEQLFKTPVPLNVKWASTPDGVSCLEGSRKAATCVEECVALRLSSEDSVVQLMRLCMEYAGGI